MTPSTPETTAPMPRQPELSDDERSSLSIDTAEHWRAIQKDELNTLRSHGNVFTGDYIDTFNSNIDNNLDTYLQGRGVASDAPHYDTIRQSLRDASIDRMSDEEWYARPSSRGESVAADADYSGRDLHVRRANEYVAAHAIAPEDDDAVEQARSEVALALDNARATFSTLAAKRQGSAVRGENEEYKAARDEYYTQMREYGRLSLREKLEDDTLSSEDKNIEVIRYSLEEQTKLRNETQEKLNGTRIGRFVRFMNRGDWKLRAAKGVALGLISGAVGALLVGATGAVVVAGAAAAASRFVRGYVAHDKKRELGQLDHDAARQTILDNFDATPADADGDIFDSTEDHLRAHFDKETKIQQTERRKALAWGVGSVAVGAALGATVAYGLNHGHSLFDNPPQANGGGTPDQAPRTPVAPSGPETGDHTTPPAGPGEANQPPNGREILPTVPGEGEGEALHHLVDYDAAFTIVPSEGLYQTFQEMGVPSTMWHDVMTDVGPKLHDLGYTYWDQAHAEWRISHTGQWSNAAMKIMTDAATQRGYSLAA